MVFIIYVLHSIQPKIVFEKLAFEMYGIPICIAIPHPIGPYTPLVHINHASNDNIAIWLI